MKKRMFMLPPVALAVLLLSSTQVFAVEPENAKLTHESKPLLDLGAEASGVKGKLDVMPVAPPPVTGSAAKPSAPKLEPRVEPTLIPPKPASVAVKRDEKNNTQTDAKHDQAWGYSGATGPEHWAELSTENKTCKTGRNQSPIDLRDQNAVDTVGLPPLDVVYQDVPLKVINTGRSVQVNYPLGSYIKLGKDRYELMDFHFHTPSEHQKEGFHYPMEVQLKHRNGDGDIVMMSILFQEGEENETLGMLIPRLPTDIGKQHLHNSLGVNPAGFIPADAEFYKYSGSLTTPPCTEGVYWMVFKQPVHASAQQIQRLSDLMGDNSRPLQSMNARTVLKSWSEQLQAPQLYEFY